MILWRAVFVASSRVLATAERRRAGNVAPARFTASAQVFCSANADGSMWTWTMPGIAQFMGGDDRVNSLFQEAS
jgi:hypothetical protein